LIWENLKFKVWIGLFRLENMMNPSLLLLVFCFAGVSLKMADFLGERKTGFSSFLVSAVSAFLFWLLLKDNPETATFMFAVVVGCVLALKVDRLNLVFGLGVLAVLCVFFGFSFPIFWLFILFSLTVVLDEITHEKFVEVGKKGLFFRFRGFF